MRRIALLVAVPLLSLLPLRADALTVRDILELTRAGLGEEILLTLIDVDRSVFPIDTATLKRLKDAGVSERVILAMIRSARMPAPAPEPIAAVGTRASRVRRPPLAANSARSLRSPRCNSICAAIAWPRNLLTI